MYAESITGTWVTRRPSVVMMLACLSSNLQVQQVSAMGPRWLVAASMDDVGVGLSWSIL